MVCRFWDDSSAVWEEKVENMVPLSHKLNMSKGREQMLGGVWNKKLLIVRTYDAPLRGRMACVIDGGFMTSGRRIGFVGGWRMTRMTPSIEYRIRSCFRDGTTRLWPFLPREQLRAGAKEEAQAGK